MPRARTYLLFPEPFSLYCVLSPHTPNSEIPLSCKKSKLLKTQRSVERAGFLSFILT